MVALPTPAQALQFGVYPGNTFTFGKFAGLGATNGPNPAATLASMQELAGGRPFQVHLYAQWDRGVPASLEQEIARYLDAGLTINLALKYVPPAGHDGDVAGFAQWVANTVAAHPQVAVWQITNEANVFFSPDSDGGAKDPVGALVAGVRAAAAAKTAGQTVGFNWFYSLGPLSDRRFWKAIGQRGGPAFRAAVDWVGIDIYEGTYIPPLVSLDHERAFRTALKYLRDRMMPLAGLPASVPVHVQETGWPTLRSIRTETEQAAALRGYVRASRAMGVALLMWFQLADAQAPLGDGWGLLHADFSRKPAFDVLREAVAVG
jgi:hypothetical protein